MPYDGTPRHDGRRWHAIIFALMDGDGDGTVSLQEFQAAHERIFKAMDTDKDGTLTLEEIRTSCTEATKLLHSDRTDVDAPRHLDLPSLLRAVRQDQP